MDKKRSLYSMQQEVDEYIQQFKVGYFSPLAQMARLTEEVGELAREVNHTYGEKSKKASEPVNSVAEELGDVLFVTMIMANSLNIDLTEVFEKTWKNSIKETIIALSVRTSKQDEVVLALKTLKRTCQTVTMQLSLYLRTRNTQERLEK
ncbi:nucleotide pyrophosphohydrolase [Enterococcus faecium]|uniref:nucleotide pyrophosphohydrolase n=1 Tax=Enterococcus faecium TaxID=1352 RepID=UPI00211AE236|nr:nucleotide pyrophosphohydrolase [Enterococcus faecium]MCC9079687.1 nucleotide pyrophosphohydrolase [Enterococcus faecium]MCC9082316.1 nucleotide pyrophosphohydrolase [Enterococcus faecium]MCC9082809.1 nucleotide pyrophosphohydrolase [Enterococcus faecium]MCC9084615.1 nucleotide pyrophosphohydrolase [Enterococcus faecium]MCU7721087.1 nucleotide pyrophosphohydrolase [Enterococcus faecium]